MTVLQKLFVWIIFVVGIGAIAILAAMFRGQDQPRRDDPHYEPSDAIKEDHRARTGAVGKDTN